VVNTTERSATTTKTKKKKKNEARSSGRDHREEEYDDDSTSASEQYSSSQYVYNEMYGLCAEEDSDSGLAESPILGPRRSAPTSHSSSASAKPKKEKKVNGRKGIAGNGPANVSYESLDKAMSGHFTFANRRKQAEQTKAAEAKKKKTTDGDDGEAREDDDGYILDVDDDDVVAEDAGTTAGEVSEGYIDVAGAAEGGGPERQQLEGRSDEANSQCYAWTQGEEEEEDEQEEEEQSASAQMTKKKSTKKKATMTASGDDEAELLTDWNSRFQVHTRAVRCTGDGSEESSPCACYQFRAWWNRCGRSATTRPAPSNTGSTANCSPSPRCARFPGLEPGLTDHLTLDDAQSRVCVVLPGLYVLGEALRQDHHRRDPPAAGDQDHQACECARPPSSLFVSFFALLSFLVAADADRPFGPLTGEVGGVAGGVKYIVQNILFKFAVDYKGIYGSDYAAAKVKHLLRIVVASGVVNNTVCVVCACV
jgi:hypothetical protein